ncbi:MAG TPA: glycosyltransferase family 10 [Oscillospiraceae bacterium]|nr:glycosyltransferase family 10 [Oscillospiraceae bacterium]HPS35928.1 glycosyltransferase family 10 [Oscillospiraceae bacterium]
MEKRKIKAAFVDFWEPIELLKKTILLRTLEKYYEIEFSDDPDYVFASCFGLFNTGALKYKNAIRIFISFENLWPDFDLYDYAVTCFPLQYGDRHLTHPYCFDHNDYDKSIESAKNKHLTAAEDFARKTGFCSFVVSNNIGDPFREEFFDRLSTYQKIDSAGRFRNNVGQKNGIKDKFAFASQRKFSITFENSKVDGYVTEKILEGFAAHTIPIYWGSPDVNKYFNPAAFIYIKGPEDVDDAIEKIKYLDQNDEAYIKMLSQPAFSSPDIAELTHKELEEFLRHIIEQPKEAAYRRAMYGYSIYKERRLIISAKVAGPLKKCKLILIDVYRKLKKLTGQ